MMVGKRACALNTIVKPHTCLRIHIMVLPSTIVAMVLLRAIDVNSSLRNDYSSVGDGRIHNFKQKVELPASCLRRALLLHYYLTNLSAIQPMVLIVPRICRQRWIIVEP
jgi:hypothetical protein